MSKTVTIALPLYKRLEYLPQALEVVTAQDYPHLELLVSDNGVNGPGLRDTVARLYPRPFSFRQNAETVVVAEHFNQILRAAKGEYIVFLGDDDGLSPNFASSLAEALDNNPRAAMAFSRQEIVAEGGAILTRSVDVLPEVLSGPEFIRAIWQDYRFRFNSVSTYLGRREWMIAHGGYPDFFRGTHIDDAQVLQLALAGDVVFKSDCVFRKLMLDTSLGWSINIGQLELATRQFARYLDDNPSIRKYAAEHPATWEELKRLLLEMNWRTYLERWKKIYRGRMPYWSWARAALALPWKRAYYREALRLILQEFRESLSRDRTAPSAPAVAAAAKSCSEGLRKYHESASHQRVR